MTKFRSISYSDEQLRKLSFGRVTNDKDVNRNGNHVTTPAGGIYDVRIFGSNNRCDCGKSFPKNSTCPECGTRILGPADLNKRVGHMELKYPYINPLDVPVFIQKLTSTLDFPEKAPPKNASLAKLLIFINNYNYRIVEDTETTDEEDIDFVMEPYNQAVKLIIEPLTEDVKWEDKTAGIIGLQRFLDNCNSMKGRDLKGLRNYIHNVFMVSPANLRMYSIRTGVANPVQLPEISLYYKILIKVNNEAQSLIMNEPEIYDKLAIIMNINKIIAIINNSNQVIATSKQSFVRSNIQSRVDKTGRATISGSMDLPITHVGLPRYLVYHSLQTDIINALKNDPDFTGNPIREYQLATPLCLKKLDEIVEHSVALVVRNPTLHKFNLTAFRIILEDKDTIGLSNAVCESYNADFDGDQMAYYINTDPIKSEEIFQTMGAESHWFYTKSRKAVYSPNREILQGLGEATKYVPSGPQDVIPYYETLEAMEEDYLADKLPITKQVLLKNPKEGEPDIQNSYGRLKVTNILGFNVDDMIGIEPGDCICAKNIDKIVAMLFEMTDKSEKLLKLQKFGMEVLKRIGVTTLSLKDLYLRTDKYKVIFDGILNSDISESEKAQRLEFELQKHMDDMVNDLPMENIKETLKFMRGKSLNGLKELICPKITVDNDGHYDISYSTSLGGKNTKMYVQDCIDNRQVLNFKQALTPIGGYNARQFATLGIRLRYRNFDNPNKDVMPIMIPETANLKGREIVEGNALPGYKLVRSCVFNGEDNVYKNEVGSYFYQITKNTHTNEKELKDNTAIGIDFATALGEAFTQSALGLKHGGSEWKYSDDCIKAPEDVEFMEANDKFIKFINTDKTMIYQYPLPLKWFKSTTIIDTNKAKKGEPLFYSGEMVHVTNSIASVSAFTGTRVADDNLKKRMVSLTECYAANEGVIRYSDDFITIGSVVYKRDKTKLYYFPEGSKVKLFDRICSGVMDTQSYLNKLNGNLQFLYILYRKQMIELTNKDVNEDAIEVMFKLTKDNGFSVEKSNKIKTNFIDSIYKGGDGGKAVMNKFLNGEIGFDSDDSIIQQILFHDGIRTASELLNKK